MKHDGPLTQVIRRECLSIYVGKLVTHFCNV